MGKFTRSRDARPRQAQWGQSLIESHSVTFKKKKTRQITTDRFLKLTVMIITMDFDTRAM